MKGALLCFCLLSITAAWPVNKSKQQATSASSEEKYDPKYHYSQKYRHHSWESLQHPQEVLPQQTLYSSEESVDVSVHQQIPDVWSKSHEDVDGDDDDDSNDTDESDEVTTIFPTDIALTFPPFTQSDTAGRGDSVAYRLRAKARLLKSSKLSKAAQKLIAYDATEEDESTLDADSQQEVLSREDSDALRSLRKKTISEEWAGKSHGQASSELDSKQRDRSTENESRQKFDSQEAADDSKALSGAREDSRQSLESRESPASPETPDHNSNQTAESAEDARDRHSIETNEVTL
ncbi:osteopontin [Indicator indicator]|uniref:osteopontin n=1 Tax=Indicator indicator TaxID=1002788 RepID=UPI0023DE76C1|nr:osteopontin [Indicator indicator]